MARSREAGACDCAHTCNLADATGFSGELQELQGLAQSDQNQPIQELLVPIEQDDQVLNPSLLLHGHLLLEHNSIWLARLQKSPLNTEKPRPQSIAASAQKSLPGLSQTPIAPALSHEERDLHRHAGVEGVFPNRRIPTRWC